MKEIEREIAEVEEEISKLNRELTKNKIEKQDLRSKISELRDPALIAELSTFEQKSREINERIVELNSEIKNITLQIESIHHPEKEKTEQIIKQLDKDE